MKELSMGKTIEEAMYNADIAVTTSTQLNLPNFSTSNRYVAGSTQVTPCR